MGSFVLAFVFTSCGCVSSFPGIGYFTISASGSRGRRRFCTAANVWQWHVLWRCQLCGDQDRPCRRHSARAASAAATTDSAKEPRRRRGRERICPFSGTTASAAPSPHHRGDIQLKAPKQRQQNHTPNPALPTTLLAAAATTANTCLFRKPSSALDCLVVLLRTKAASSPATTKRCGWVGVCARRLHPVAVDEARVARIPFLAPVLALQPAWQRR